MLALKSEPAPAEEGLLASFDPASIQAELDIWEHLNFSFDMDKDQHNPRQGASSSGRGGASNRARSSSTPGAGGIPPAGSSRSAASASGAPPAGWIPPNAPFPPPTSPENYEALARALRTVQEAYPYFPAQSGGYPPPQGLPAQRYPPQLPPEQYSQFPWPPAPPQSQAQSASQFNTTFPPFPYSQGGQYGGSPPPHTTQLSHLNAQLQPLTTGSPASASGSPSSGQGQDMSPVDELTMSEEKRRRNTAASARFRIKKKQKTLNLERTVSDLNGRVDELEQEAADLRRENGWLKEIVMLKSTRTPGQSSSAAGPSNTGKKAEKDSEEESDEDTDGGGNASKAKGKGKGKGKEKSR